MGTVRIFPASVSGVRLADAVTVFLGTIPAANTRRGYGVVLNRLVADFGADTNVALLDQEQNRVGGWFTFVWGSKAATTFNVRLAALRSACEYWREQTWLIGDPLVRLRARPAPPDTSKALTKVLWHMLYESSARAEEVLMLDVVQLDTTNRCAVVTRKTPRGLSCQIGLCRQGRQWFS